MPGAATHPFGTPSPASPESPRGLNLETGSESFISTQDSPSLACYIEAKESLSYSHEDSSNVNFPLNPSHNETSKDANAVVFKRSEVQELRTALRFKREEESNIRAQFIRYATVAQGTLTSIQSLLQNNEALLSATGIYSGIEAEYNRADLGDVRSTTSSAPERIPQMYVSCVADARMIQERLIDLDREWLIIQEKKEGRESLNMPMDDESFDDKLFHARLDMNQLRTVCFEKDLLKASTEENTSPSEPREEKFSQTKLVNKWLLHRLRRSTIEIGNLKSLQEIKSLSVTEQWFEDEATISPPPPPPATSDMSLQEPASVRDTVSGSHSV
ncbi:hypothetical protein BDV40DRAFT_287486 [Aspergillus tamarii]|uniref:Uncharacterized protein n=1 Tax=Aspergillus tamarii TaxID=41984 RepID=A0A5N6UYJ3_ASPTM|nr:hypothetical protein BDV40DRAFT_287486 [Aspergillus tamarii]